MKAKAGAQRAIIKETRFATRPERLFDAFVDPLILARWFVRSAHTDPRPGGRWHFDFGDHQGGRVGGEYVVVQRPRHLVWTWNEWTVDEVGAPVRPEPEGEPAWAVTVCDIQITDLGVASALRLVHTGYPNTSTWDDLYHGVSTGWDLELEKLRGAVE